MGFLLSLDAGQLMHPNDTLMMHPWFMHVTDQEKKAYTSIARHHE